MSRHIADEVSTRRDWSACASIGNVMPPRDPDEEDDEEDEEDEKDDGADEPAVVREPEEG